jgi:[glutamine synthetase] adenylyltransferase / [glutamine synthetase]-adenylyl-L-tyrosine phosphorylase
MTNSDAKSPTTLQGFGRASLKPLRPDHAHELVADFIETARGGDFAAVADAIEADTGVAAFLGAAFDLSPFLRDS